MDAARRRAGLRRAAGAGAVREVLEETGCDVRLGELLGVRSDVLEPAQTVSGHRVQTVGIVFRGTVTGGELRDEFEGSTDGAAWIPFDRLDALPVGGPGPWARPGRGPLPCARRSASTSRRRRSSSTASPGT